MSILSDKQIRQLCIAPTHKVCVGPFVGDHREWKRVTLPFKSSTLRTYSEPVEIPYEETLGFVPMIFPFVPEQVKTRLRSLSVEEETILDQAGFHKSQMKMLPVPMEIVNNLDYDNRGELKIKEKIISYGTSSYGYDVRLARKFKIFTNIKSVMIDPLNMSDDCYIEHEGDFVIVPPHSYVLGHTVETFNIPRDITVICVGKSTYARAGCAINVTPIEAGFNGQVVIEIANQTPLPMKVYAEMGIAQFMFLQGDEECEVSYADRDGKYQGQMGITTAKV